MSTFKLLFSAVLVGVYILAMCPGLSHPANGTVSVTSRTSGSIATYTCNTGFELTTESDMRTCQGDSTWTGMEPKCIGRQKITGFNEHFINSYHSFSQGDCDW